MKQEFDKKIIVDYEKNKDIELDIFSAIGIILIYILIIMDIIISNLNN